MIDLISKKPVAKCGWLFCLARVKRERRCNWLERILMTRLSKAQAKSLLYELCVRLGFCLPSADVLRLENDPPVEVDSFADAVFIAEGMDPHAHPRLRQQVCECIAAHFAKAAEGAGDQTL